tara:strand:+ start:368 stop:679 length:312 start_codon:yes stop_codon:yes gene_type:complete
MTTTRKRRSTKKPVAKQAELLPPPVRKGPVLPNIKPEYKTVNVKRVKPNPELISIDSYWQDIRNRASIHNYEFSVAMDDLQNAVKWTNKKLDKLCDRVRQVAP